MKGLLDKLNGVLADADLKELQESITKAVDERVSLRIDEETKKLKEESDKVLEEAIQNKALELETAQTENIKKLEEHIKDELDRFLENQVLNSINESLFEEYAKNFAAAPLLQDIIQLIETKYVSVDTKGHELLKEAATEIETKRNEVSEQISRNLDLEKIVEGYKKKEFITESVKDLSDDNKKRVEMFFGDKTLDETKEKLPAFLEMITEKPEPIIENKENKLLKESVVPSNDNLEPKNPETKHTNTVLAEANAYL